MADLEAVLADVSYLMAMEKSKCTPAARASKKISLPDPSVRSVMIKHLERMGEITFDKIFNQRLGYLLFKDFCPFQFVMPFLIKTFHPSNVLATNKEIGE